MLFCYLFFLPVALAFDDEIHSIQRSSKFINRGEATGGHDELECGVRLAAFRFAPVLPRNPRNLFDALELGTRCQMNLEDVMAERLTAVLESPAPAKTVANEQRNGNAVQNCDEFFVDEGGTSYNTYPTLTAAIKSARLLISSPCKKIFLAPGITYLNETIKLGEEDSGTMIIGAADGTSWLSSGIPIKISMQEAVLRRINTGTALIEIPVPRSIRDVPGLFSVYPHIRYQRARWPNADSERTLWERNSEVSLDGGNVKEWIKPKPISGSEFIFVDLTKPNPTGFIKNDTIMTPYNTYVSGRGGICDEIWDTSYGSSYWCSNATGGGWAEVDAEFADHGTAGLPVGLAYYNSDNVGKRIEGWGDVSGAVVHAFHSQSWFTNMFEVVAHDKDKSTLHFGRGGSQGGRSWCRCNQCSYAGHWCKRDNDGNIQDDRLISGRWYIENVLDELDSIGEFFFVESNRTILLLVNESDILEKRDMVFVVPHLATLVDINGADNIHISNVGFRDTRYTYLEKHGVPSGGDWSLYKGAALMLANTKGTVVTDCTFSRLDGTAILLTEYTREVSIKNNEFEWLGESAMAAWGYTEEWDGRDGRQPRGTLIEGNVVREIGIYEKQSSAWFQAKACNTTLRDNLFFNMPRAAINFNDGFGGSNLVRGNLLFNTCRESGDHGPINTWDRQPFLWDSSGVFGFNTPPSIIENNFLVANYGAGQGIDNDDGSSFYYMSANVIIGDGFKSDYGGHDSKFMNNLVIVSPYDGQNCINVGSFKAGYQHSYSGNICAILSCNRHDCDDLVGTIGDSCDSAGFPFLSDNYYYTKNGNATLRCGGTAYRIDEIQQKFDYIEVGSTYDFLPDDSELIQWIINKVDSILTSEN